MLGVDVSNWQGNVDWAALKAAGVSFAFVKATEGVAYTDSYLERNRLGANQNQIAVGVYHFARPDKLNTAFAEATYFCDQYGSVRANELRPVLDLEVGPVSPAWAIAWLTEVERRLGVRPMIYSYPNFLSGLAGKANYESLKQWPLWLASYGADDGQEHDFDPMGFRVVEHQYTSKGSLAGMTGIDLDSAHDLNVLREEGDYLLWREYKLSALPVSQKPLGLPGTIPYRWQRLFEQDSALIWGRAYALLDPVKDALSRERSALDAAEAKISAAKAALA